MLEDDFPKVAEEAPAALVTMLSNYMYTECRDNRCVKEIDLLFYTILEQILCPRQTWYNIF